MGASKALYNSFQVLLGTAVMKAAGWQPPIWSGYRRKGPAGRCHGWAGCHRNARDGFPASCNSSWRRRSPPAQQACSSSTAPPIPPAIMVMGGVRTGEGIAAVLAAPSPWWRWSAMRSTNSCWRPRPRSITASQAVGSPTHNRVFVVNGPCQKGWAMTGWRLGYLAGAAEVVAAPVPAEPEHPATSAPFCPVTDALAALGVQRHLCHRKWPTQFQASGRRRLLLTAWPAFAGGFAATAPGLLRPSRYQRLRPFDSMTFCNRVARAGRPGRGCLVWPSATTTGIRPLPAPPPPPSIPGWPGAPRTIF